MAKKLPNSKQLVQHGNISVSFNIVDKLNEVAKTEAMIALNKDFRRARTNGKRARLAANANAKATHSKHSIVKMDDYSFRHKLKEAEKKMEMANHPFAHPDEVMRRVPLKVREQYDVEWNHEAHTGVVGTRPKRPPVNDVRYKAYPYVNRK